MAQHFKVHSSSVIAQSALPKTQRGQSDNASELQLKLLQKNASANAVFAPLRSDASNAGLSNSVTVRNSNVLSNGAQSLSIRNTAAATASNDNAQVHSIIVDDSMLLNLLKQIVDSEFSKSRSSVVVHESSVQDSEIQIKRDAVFGVLRSALDVAHQSNQDQIAIQSSPDLREQSKLHIKSESTEALDSAPRVESKQSFNILLQEASRLASVVTSMSPSFTIRTNFLWQDRIRAEMINSESLVWRLVEHDRKTVQYNSRSSTHVARSPILASIQEKEYGTAPLWYQQDMENGPPISAISSIQRTWRVLNN